MTSRLAVCTSLLVLIAACPVRAEDDAPVYGASDLALEDDGLLQGWEIVYEDVEGTPGEALAGWAGGVAVTSGLEDDAVYLETCILKGPEGVGATIVLVEVDGDPKNYVDDLSRKGQANGYVVRAMGHPSRIAIVAAPEALRKQVVDMQVTYGVNILARLGWQRLLAGSRLGAQRYAKGGRAIDPKAGPPLVVLGMVATEAEEWDEAIEALRAGFGPGASIKAKGRLAMRGYAHLGYALLQKKEAKLDREAREAFEKCVALESQGDPKEDPLFIQRYNLACAHSRLKEIDGALTHLEKSLEMYKERFSQQQLTAWVKNHVLKDEDFDNIKDHPGFKSVTERFMGGGTAHGPPGGI